MIKDGGGGTVTVNLCHPATYDGLLCDSYVMNECGFMKT